MAVFNMLMGNGVGIGAIMEWVAIFSYLGWIGMLSYKAR